MSRRGFDVFETQDLWTLWTQLLSKSYVIFIVIPGLIFLNLVFYLYSPYNINLNGH